MGILRGLFFGLLLCGFALFLFFFILGGVSAVGTQSARSNLERQVDEQLVSTGARPAMRRMVNSNVRIMNDALIRGRPPTEAEAEAAAARAGATQERVSHYLREREARQADRRAGSPGPRAGSAAPMASARPMVDLGAR